jgi:predicted permease
MSIVSWLNRRRLADENSQEEIRAHRAIAADERVADGADRQRAGLGSLTDFGNIALTTDVVRRVSSPWWLDAFHDPLNDVRHAIRVLARSPAFALTVVAVLTLGIGLNAAVFTMLKSLALNPVAGVEDSAELRVVLGETSTGRKVGVSYLDYQYVRDYDRAFSGLLGSVLLPVNLGRGRSAHQIMSELVTGNYFQVLGVRAERGRTLLPSDEIAPGRHPVVVLSDGLWRRDFGADPEIVGKTVEINDYLLTVVGVADSAFHGTIVSYDVELFIPLMMARQMGVTVGTSQSAPSQDILSDRRAGILMVLGHLRPHTTLANAAAQTDALSATLSRDAPLTDIAQRLKVISIWQSPYGAQTYLLPAVIVMSAMGLLVLMVACANIAGLVLVRGVSRRSEMAVRVALGATRARIVRLLMLENLILAVPGAALGLLLALRGIPILVANAQAIAAPQRLFFNIDVDRLVIAYSVLVACASALVFGFVPALRTSRIDLVSVIKDDTSPRGAARGPLRAALVVVQVAVSLLLLVGAGLVTRSLESARRVNPGFDSSHVTSLSVNVRANGYDETRGRVFYRHLLDAARADPGIESATLAAANPLAVIDTRALRVAIEGYEPRRAEDLAFMSNTVGPDYFRTLRVQLAAGREFADRDDETGAPVVIVNDTLARRFWGSAANAIGKRVRVGDGDWRMVIGVAADLKYSRINEAPRPYIYLPFLQSYRPSMILHTRGSAPVAKLVDQARARVAALDGELPILYARPLAELTRAALVIFELVAAMLFLFGAAGMALAAMGLYGLVAYSVKQSTHEIGIRMALGAHTFSIVRQFLLRGLRLCAIGAALGIAGAFGVTRLLSSVLFGVSATDPLSYLRALAIILGSVIVATIIPAWRAGRTNPLDALRHQ